LGGGELKIAGVGSGARCPLLRWDGRIVAVTHIESRIWNRFVMQNVTIEMKKIRALNDPAA
jgi:hypothetical protein